MLINHLIFVGGYWLSLVNHDQLTFVEDAQGFVFLSGLLAGIVYGRRMSSQGYEAASPKVWRRALELYVHAMAIIVLILAVREIIPDGAAVWRNWLGDSSLGQPVRLAAIGTLLFQPTFMDILPQYVIYMVFAPPIIWLCITGRWIYVVAISLLLWMAAQLGLQRLVTETLNNWVMGVDHQGIRVSFNMFGWQIVFVAGLVCGALTASGKIDWSRILRPEFTFIPKICLLFFCFFLPLRIATAHGLMPSSVIGKFASMEIRADFGPVYLLNFPAIAIGLAWLLIAGPKHPNLAIQRVAAALTWLFSLGFLKLLGRHSLQVYVWHVVIVYAVYYVDRVTPEFSELTKTGIALVAVALLALPALWRERDRFIGTLPPKLASG